MPLMYDLSDTVTLLFDILFEFSAILDVIMAVYATASRVHIAIKA